MINLAGKTDCDIKIREELELAQVPLFTYTHDRKLGHATLEVPWTVFGMLEGFIFTRAWYYWIVEGRMPISVAREIYHKDVGKKTVRAGGHCGCVPPEEQARWFDQYGNRLIESHELEQFRHFWSKGLLDVPDDKFGRFVFKLEGSASAL